MKKTICYQYDIYSGIELILCNNSTISYPLHNHVSTITIGFLLEGSILLTANSASNTYYKNDYFMILPYVPHSIAPNGHYTLLSLCIHTNSLKPYNTNILKENITNLLLNTNRMSQKQIDQLLHCLFSFCENSVFNDKDKTFSHINPLIQQLELHPEHYLSIEDMAHSIFTSKFHFIRSFKRQVGLTPHQFQLQNRIRKAQRLLPNMVTITEAALTTGFCDQSHFIKQFEKLVGLTPSAYKHSYKVIPSNSDHC